MMYTRICVWTLVALSGVAAPAEEDFIAPEPLHEAGLVKFWQLQLPLAADQQLQRVYLVDEHLYLATDDGYAFAVHANTGIIRWLRPITRSGYPVWRPCHANSKVIFVTPVDVQIYERLTGEPVARRALRFPPGTGAVSDGIRFYLGGLDRRLYALDVETLYEDWKLVTDGPITSIPALFEDSVTVANDGGTVYACTRDNKAYRWHAVTHDSISADLVVHAEHGVFVASRDLSLYLLDFNHGNVRWRARLSGPLYEAPVVTSELAYQYCPADGVVAVDTGIGVEERVRWKLPEGRQALTVHKDTAYILTKDGTIATVRTADGVVTHRIPAPGLTLGIPAPDAATIFMAAPDGRLFCARPRGVRPLKREDLLDALRPPATEEGLPDYVRTPATRPAVDVNERLRTKRRGAPIGGRSKVSRGFQGGEGR